MFAASSRTPLFVVVSPQKRARLGRYETHYRRQHLHRQGWQQARPSGKREGRQQSGGRLPPFRGFCVAPVGDYRRRTSPKAQFRQSAGGEDTKSQSIASQRKERLAPRRLSLSAQLLIW